jgi:hypothetical protein
LPGYFNFKLPQTIRHRTFRGFPAILLWAWGCTTSVKLLLLVCNFNEEAVWRDRWTMMNTLLDLH